MSELELELTELLLATGKKKQELINVEQLAMRGLIEANLEKFGLIAFVEFPSTASLEARVQLRPGHSQEMRKALLLALPKGLHSMGPVISIGHQSSSESRVSACPDNRTKEAQS